MGRSQLPCAGTFCMKGAFTTTQISNKVAVVDVAFGWRRVLHMYYCTGLAYTKVEWWDSL
jgi:hypothetical protein